MQLSVEAHSTLAVFRRTGFIFEHGEWKSYNSFHDDKMRWEFP